MLRFQVCALGECVISHPRPSLSGTGVPVGVLPGPTSVILPPWRDKIKAPTHACVVACATALVLSCGTRRVVDVFSHTPLRSGSIDVQVDS